MFGLGLIEMLIVGAILVGGLVAGAIVTVLTMKK